ncbi:unnamed protein product [Rhizophagus irregularis]|nr:unnamed protein product [Rhizophagus irregularis]
MEVDEEEARFTSESNDEILRQVIPRLIEAMKSRYTPRYRQVKSWLSALHKHRRKKACQVKGAKSLFDKNDEKLENYDRKELLNVLSDNRYHSPEYSESDEEQPDGKRHINIYNIVSRHSRGAPNWTYVEQNTLAYTNFSELETPIQTMENLVIMAEDAEVSAEMDEIVVIEDSQPTGMEESEPTEMEESELTEVEESEPMGVEESPETEDETDKWYKFVL